MNINQTRIPSLARASALVLASRKMWWKVHFNWAEL